MKVPVSWLREYVSIPQEMPVQQICDALIRAGLEVTGVESAGADVHGPIVVGKVLSAEPEPQKNGKTIHWCLVDVGAHNPEDGRGRGIVCGADNFQVGDYVVVALPGAELPGGFSIASRRTYGHVSDGMMCAGDELGMNDDHSGILLLQPDSHGLPPVPGEDAIELLHIRDDVIDVELTPDLGYCMSIRGIAREVGQLLGLRFIDPVSPLPTSPHAEGYPVEIKTEDCPVFAAVTVEGTDPSATTPRLMARRLELSGMRPVSLPVDVANYVMLETGQPLHTYDRAALKGSIVVRKAEQGEVLTTLDDMERSLTAHDLVIADDSGPIGLAGLMGGASTEVTGSTTDVVIEGAHFDRRCIQRSLNHHNLGSEASRRFARGVDPQAAYVAARRAADLLAKHGGGTRVAGDTLVGEPPTPKSTRLSAELPTQLLGFDVVREEVIDILSASQVEVTALGDTLTVVPPTWRFDLVDPYDYVEEIGRKRGLDEVVGVLPVAPPGRGLNRFQRSRRRVAHALAQSGYVEVMTLPFVGPQEMPWAADDLPSMVRLANPLTSEQPFLRRSLLPGLLSAVLRNRARSIDDVTLFELGRVFLPSTSPEAPSPSVERRPDAWELEQLDAALPQQPWHVAMVGAGEWFARGGSGPSRELTWAHMIDAALKVGEEFGIELSRKAADQAPWHPGRCAELSMNGVVVGFAGELHPSMCQTLGLPARTCAAEIDLDLLGSAAPDFGQIPALSRHAIVKEDVALIVDRGVSAGDVAQGLRDGAGDLLESVRLFDVYEGDQVPQGKKSLAFAMTLRAPDRTLTHQESALVKDAALRTVAERHGAVQRDF